MSDGVIGFSVEEINALRGKINDTAQSCAEGIVSKLEQSIVTPMSTIWYAGEAVEFFEAFKTTVSNTGTVIHDAFDSFRNSIQEAGKFWAENTHSPTSPELPALDEVTLDLNVDSIKAVEEGTNRSVIDPTRANSLAGSLEALEGEIRTYLEGQARQLDATTAFIGGDQASAITTCFEKVGGEVSKIFNFLYTGEGTEDGKSLKENINAAVEKYQTMATDVSTTYNNAAAEEE